jgi:hypothetical protein
MKDDTLSRRNFLASALAVPIAAVAPTAEQPQEEQIANSWEIVGQDGSKWIVATTTISFRKGGAT